MNHGASGTMGAKGNDKQETKRKTLLEKASEVNIRDPAQHTKRQVGELDKQANGSMIKRKLRLEQIDSDSKEIAFIDEEIARIKSRYDPLCVNLKERQQRRKDLIATLESCVKDEKRIMGNTKGTVDQRRIDEMKLSRSLCSTEMAVQRGFTVTAESTFHQSRKFGSMGQLGTLNMSLAPLGSSGGLGGTGKLPLIASSALPGKR
jgi:hypothetical protein